MFVVDKAMIAVPFGKWRKHDHADRTVGDCGLIPRYEQGALLVGRRSQDDRDGLRQPVVSLLDLLKSISDRIASRRTGIQSRGGTDGADLDDWLQAERELRSS